MSCAFHRSEPHVNIEIVDYFTKLVIRPVSRANSGQYTVSAVNSSGKDTATINVTVTDKPTPPVGPLQVFNRRFRCAFVDRVIYISSSRIERLSFRSPTCTRRAASCSGNGPTTTAALRSSTTWWRSSTRRRAAGYRADGRRKLVGIVRDGKKRDGRRHGCVNVALFTALNVTSLTPDKEYKFRVTAVNAEGESAPLQTEESIVAKNPFGTYSARVAVVSSKRERVPLRFFRRAGQTG